MYQYRQKKGTVTGSFILKRPSTVNQLTILTGWVYGHHHLKKFKLRLQVDCKWFPVKVTEVSSPGWKITKQDEIFLPNKTGELKIKFNPVDQVTGVQITIIDSWPSDNVVFNEITVQNGGVDEKIIEEKNYDERFPAKNVLTNEDDDVFSKNYWLTKNDK